MKTHSPQASITTAISTTLTKARRLLAGACVLLTLATVQTADAQVLHAWGNNDYGQSTNKPTGGFKKISSGRDHNVAIRLDGTLVSWGADFSGVVSLTPTGTFKEVAAGYDYSVAIRTDGTLYAWGTDGWGEVSNVPAGTFKAVAAGEGHAVAIRTDGSLVSWGNDINGMVRNTPTTGTYTAVAAGAFHSMALRSDGGIASWGWNSAGQVSDIPAGPFIAIAAGFNHSSAIKADGSLATWGSNGGGVRTMTPTTGTFKAVVGGNGYGAALTTDGAIVSWFSDFDGIIENTPTEGVFTEIAAGWAQMLAIQGACAPKSVEFSPDAVVIGGTGVIGTVTLTEPAPAGGLTVKIRANNTLVTSQVRWINIPEGETQGSFAIATLEVPLKTGINFTVSANGVLARSRLTLMPPVLLGILVPSWTTGPSTLTAVLYIGSPAPAGGLVVNLASSRTIAATVPATVTVPAGATTVTFPVTCNRVTVTTATTIKATHPGSGEALAYVKVFK